jgi:hypothetical protein
MDDFNPASGYSNVEVLYLTFYLADNSMPE